MLKICKKQLRIALLKKATSANTPKTANHSNQANNTNISNNTNRANSKLYVITGTILNTPLGKIGKNKVTIPSHFYKIIYSQSKNKIIAFLVPNQKIIPPLEIYTTTVDAIEFLTKIDFFPQLEDSLEDVLESKLYKASYNRLVRKLILLCLKLKIVDEQYFVRFTVGYNKVAQNDLYLNIR